MIESKSLCIFLCRVTGRKTHTNNCNLYSRVMQKYNQIESVFIIFEVAQFAIIL